MESFRSKPVYSPRDAALICAVDSNVFDAHLKSGKIQSFQIPGGHTRIARVDLISFMDSESIPVPASLKEAPQPFRVLVVEDDPDLLEIFTELLHDEPHVEVRAENNGFTAGLQIAGWHPDVILLDFLMPRISGFEICSKLRSHLETRDIPVLALTALNADEDKKAIFESGASDYLGKPFRSAELIQKVRALLGLDHVSLG